MPPDLLAGLPKTGTQLCDYSDEPGWAIPPRDLETGDDQKEAR